MVSLTVGLSHEEKVEQLLSAIVDQNEEIIGILKLLVLVKETQQPTQVDISRVQS